MKPRLLSELRTADQSLCKVDIYVGWLVLDSYRNGFLTLNVKLVTEFDEYLFFEHLLGIFLDTINLFCQLSLDVWYIHGQHFFHSVLYFCTTNMLWGGDWGG